MNRLELVVGSDHPDERIEIIVSVDEALPIGDFRDEHVASLGRKTVGVGIAAIP